MDPAPGDQESAEHQVLDPFFGCPHTSSAGENIAYGYDTPRALVSAWMHSKGHRANILSRHFNRIGVSGWRATDGVTYATQDFLGADSASDQVSSSVSRRRRTTSRPTRPITTR